jgi:hypothetical protein
VVPVGVVAVGAAIGMNALPPPPPPHAVKTAAAAATLHIWKCFMCFP